MTEFFRIFSTVILTSHQINVIQLPIITGWIGGGIVVVFSFCFVRLIQLKIEGWNRNKLSPLPLANFYTVTSWLSTLLGLTVMFTGVLQIFNFSTMKSFIASLLLAIITGIPMWGVVKQLLVEVESGTIKEIDEYF